MRSCLSGHTLVACLAGPLGSRQPQLASQPHSTAPTHTHTAVGFHGNNTSHPVGRWCPDPPETRVAPHRGVHFGPQDGQFSPILAIFGAARRPILVKLGPPARPILVNTGAPKRLILVK